MSEKNGGQSGKPQVRKPGAPRKPAASTLPNWEERLMAARAKREQALAQTGEAEADSPAPTAPPLNFHTPPKQEDTETAAAAVPSVAPSHTRSDLLATITQHPKRALLIAMACCASLGFGFALGIGTLFGLGAMRAGQPADSVAQETTAPTEAIARLEATPAPTPATAPPAGEAEAPAPEVTPPAAETAEALPTSEIEPRPLQAPALPASDAPTETAAVDPAPAERPDTPDAPAAILGVVEIAPEPTVPPETDAGIAAVEVTQRPPASRAAEARRAIRAEAPFVAAQIDPAPDAPAASTLSLVAWRPMQPAPGVIARTEAGALIPTPPDGLPGVKWSLADKLGAAGADLDIVDLRVYAPDAVPRGRLATNLERLEDTGLAVTNLQRVGFAVSTAHIRYYNSEDRAAAQALAEALEIEARDFTGAQNGPVGLIEVWFAGSARSTGQDELETRRGGTYLFERLRDRLRSN
ncbi:hypothetical protein [uncultured Roseobacter sp.]|uniref:hypothetical protein n=1 Tax=uncultured Roseobacter sp. TaxID=114847 RepID=UPI00263200B2|nr:hypothetical protein [uncultured Roseobacter sp.]